MLSQTMEKPNTYGCKGDISVFQKLYFTGLSTFPMSIFPYCKKNIRFSASYNVWQASVEPGSFIEFNPISQNFQVSRRLKTLTTDGFNGKSSHKVFGYNMLSNVSNFGKDGKGFSSIDLRSGYSEESSSNVLVDCSQKDPDKEVPDKNSKRTGHRLFADLLAGVVTALSISPLVTVIDRSIVMAVNGTQPLVQGIQERLKELFRHPIRFARGRDHLIVCGVYAGTYCASNWSDTITDRFFGAPSELSRFVVTTFTNVFLCIRKDVVFSRMFGVQNTPGIFPMISTALFLLRDMITIFAAFIAPPYIDYFLLEINKMKNLDRAKTEELSSSDNDVLRSIETSKMSQLICPVISQFFTCPIHILALDIFNRPSSSASNRVKLVASKYPSSLAARICRIGPAFGIGGITNISIKNHLYKALQV